MSERSTREMEREQEELIAMREEIREDSRAALLELRRIYHEQCDRHIEDTHKVAKHLTERIDEIEQQLRRDELDDLIYVTNNSRGIG